MLEAKTIHLDLFDETGRKTNPRLPPSRDFLGSDPNNNFNWIINLSNIKHILPH